MAFENFRVVPPGTGICHQVKPGISGADRVDGEDQAGDEFAYPDTLFGTDSHTTMVNGIAVLGWGVGGIEAEAAMLGQPIAMLIPDVIGFRLDRQAERRRHRDRPGAGRHADAAQEGRGRQVRRVLRRRAWTTLAVATRATIANMAPEYGATCGFFPDRRTTIDYLRLTGRVTKSGSRWLRPMPRRRACGATPPRPTRCSPSTLELDLSTVEPCMAGPKRPQDRVVLSQASSAFKTELTSRAWASPANDVGQEA